MSDEKKTVAGAAETAPVDAAKGAEIMEKYEKESKCVGYVFDAVEPGSGKTFDWGSIPRLPENGKPWLLAGGLNPENVEAAIAGVHPYGVDVSSGVECASGQGKDPDKIRAFVRAVRHEK